MGRLQYAWVHEHFKNVDKPHLKIPRRQCRYCGYETKSDTTRQSTHLKQCAQYQVAGEAPHLSALATRVFSTPANSVPSERSFSAMNFVQDKYRSRLSAEKTDMLTFIYMNSKVLRRKPSEPAPTWYNLIEDQEEEFENLAYEYVCGFDDEEVS